MYLASAWETRCSACASSLSLLLQQTWAEWLTKSTHTQNCGEISHSFLGDQKINFGCCFCISLMWHMRILLGISYAFLSFCAFWLPRQNTFAGFVCPSKTPCYFLSFLFICCTTLVHSHSLQAITNLSISVILCIIYKTSDIFNNKISFINNRIWLYLTWPHFHF